MMERVKVFTETGARWASGSALLLALLFVAGPVRAAEVAGDAPAADVLAGARTGGATWVESAPGVDFGVVEFGFRGERREWNLGIGRALGFAPRSRWSFLGAGLSVTRPLRDDAADVSRGSDLEGVEVKPWVGGCLNCPLGEIVQLGLELKWAPGGAALLDDEDTGSERRAGVSLGFQW